MINDPVDVALPPTPTDTGSPDTGPAAPLPSARTGPAAGPTGSDERAARVRREQIGSDLAQTVLATTARRLAEAISEFDTALDGRASLLELQNLDREVVRARRDHAAAQLLDGEAPTRSR